MKKRKLQRTGEGNVQITLITLYLISLIVYDVFMHEGNFNEKAETYFETMVFTLIGCFAVYFVMGIKLKTGFLPQKVFSGICIILEIIFGMVTIVEGFYYFVEGYTSYALMGPVLGMVVAYIKKDSGGRE